MPITGVTNFLVVSPTLFRSGQPAGPQGWRWLADAGVKSVVKLNTEEESSDKVALDLGLTVVYKPIPLHDQLIFRPDFQLMKDAIEAMCVPGTLVHCEHGQDRTGLAVACYRVWKQGWSKSDAKAEMLQHGFHDTLLGLDLFWEYAVHAPLTPPT